MITSLVQNLYEAVREVLARGVGAIVGTTINGMVVETGTVTGGTPASVTYVRVGSFYIGFGAGAPTSVDLPAGAIYVNTLTAPSHIYVKYGPVATNWTGALSNGSTQGALNGLTVNTSPLTLNVGLVRGNALSVAVTADQTDWDPFAGSMERRSIIVATPDAARVINSMLTSGQNQEITIINGSTTAANTLTLTHDNGATGTAAQRFYAANNTSLVIPGNGGAMLWRDNAAAAGVGRWRALPLY